MGKIRDSFTGEISTDKTRINEIYQYSLYNPKYIDGDTVIAGTGVVTDKNETIESLNGALTKSNFSPEAANTLTTECFKVGTFARGYFYGFDFPDRYHEAQFDQDPIKLRNDANKTSKKYMVSSYSLSANVFVPYSSITYINYQGFFCAEAIKKDAKARDGVDNTHQYKGNRFVHHLYVDDKKYTTMVSSAPSSKIYKKDDDTPNAPSEFRWRWQNRTMCIFLDKGYHKVELFVEGCLPIFQSLTPSAADDLPNKLQHRCGSISILSIKAPDYTSAAGTHSWYEMNVFTDEPNVLGPGNDGGTIFIDPDWVLEFLDDSVPEVTLVGPENVSVGVGPSITGSDSFVSEGEMMGEVLADSYSPDTRVLVYPIPSTDSD